MAPLTWREVSAPSFSGVSESQRLAGTMLNNGFQSAIDALGRLDTSQKENANGEFLARISSYGDAGKLREALSNGTVFDGLDRGAITPETFDRANSHATALLNDVRTGVLTDGNRLDNQNQSLTNEHLQWSQNNARVDRAELDQERQISKDGRDLAFDVLQWAGGDIATAERDLRANNTVDPQVKAQALAQLGSENARILQGPDTNAAAYLLQSAIDGTEGGGQYDTLYSFSQRPEGKFAGFDPTTKTLDQLSEFDKEYGAWVKEQTGTFATPMGRFQIVGDTRRQVAKEMGLPGDTVFTPAVQDAMFQHLVDKRIGGPRSMEAKIAGLRQEWEGFKKVSDADLTAAITAYEGGDRGAISSLAGSTQPEAPATDSQQLFNTALENSGTLSRDENQALFSGQIELTNQAASVMDAMTMDGLMGTRALAQSLLDPSLASESQAASLARLRSTLGPDIDIKDPELIDNINAIRDKYGMSFGQAATVIQNTIHQEPWILRWLQGNANVDYKRFDELIGQVYNKDGKTKADKFRPGMELLETARSKQNAAAQLEQAQSLVAAAQQRYVNLLQKAKTSRTPSLERELERAQLEYQALLGQMQKTVSQIDGDPRIGFRSGG